MGDDIDMTDQLSSTIRSELEHSFDVNYYIAQLSSKCPENTPQDPLTHYIDRGEREGINPTRWFDAKLYALANPDLAGRFNNAFHHYVTEGRAEGRPLLPYEYAVAATHFDLGFYRRIYPKIGARGLSAVVDYLEAGWRENRDPSPEFSTARYLEANPDVAAAGVNPFIHYLLTGRGEGRNAFPSEEDGSPKPAIAPMAGSAPSAQAQPEAASPIVTELSEYDETLLRREFDTQYYLAKNPDVADAGVGPLAHFHIQGWTEGRDPSASFSVTDYLEEYEDIRVAGINPFLHYLLAGRTEGRIAKRQLGFRYGLIKQSLPLRARITQQLEQAPGHVNKADSAAIPPAFSRTGGRRLFISVSHDDFAVNYGGVQLCLLREAEGLEKADYDHVHIFPMAAVTVVNTPSVSGSAQEPLVGVRINGRLIGALSHAQLADGLAGRERSDDGAAFVAFHSLLGHRPQSLIPALRAAGVERGVFWIHDYASACPSYTLMRNDVQFCGAPSPSSNACQVCAYGGARLDQVAAHRAVFDAFDLLAAAPSAVALETWRSAGKLRTIAARVHAHCRLVSRDAERRRTREGPVRIGFLGRPAAHKGWPVFVDLVQRFAGRPDIEFFHLGKEPDPSLPVTFMEVQVGPGAEDAMIKAVEAARLDAALIWSLWPETFCFTTYEAIAGGAAVITSPASGNVARVVTVTGKGFVLDDEDTLVTAFEDGKIADRIRATPLDRLYSLEYSGMSADFIPELAR
jgi:glycosyltransferase involved in cell wall biosynthesis